MGDTTNLHLPLYDATDTLDLENGYNVAMSLIDDNLGLLPQEIQTIDSRLTNLEGGSGSGVEFKQLDFKYASNAGLSLQSVLYGINMGNGLCLLFPQVSLTGTPESDKASVQLTHTLPSGLTYNPTTSGTRNGIIFPISDTQHYAVVEFHFTPNILIKVNNYSNTAISGKCMQMCPYNGNYSS